MTVNDFAVKSIHLVADDIIILYHADRVHHFTQPQHQRMILERQQVFCKKLCACVFKGS